jgi:hypothetical protein
MESPAIRLITIVLLVFVTYTSVFLATQVSARDFSMNQSGIIKPFCPEFSTWLQDPRMDAGINGARSHGLGLIPAPVSFVGISPGAVHSVGKSGKPVFPVPVPAARFYSFHATFC